MMIEVGHAARIRKRRLLIASIAFIATGMATMAPSFAATSTENTPAQNSPTIIGLGDSYTAGVGATAPDAKSGVCRRSTLSYPLVAARQLGVEGANAACSGAPASALTGSFRGQLPQLEKTTGAEFIVITAGGNDVLNLASAKDFLVDDKTFTTRLDELGTTLESNFGAVVATDIEVIVLGYPEMFPADTQKCNAVLAAVAPIANNAVQRLNETVRSSAVAAGATFVDTTPAFVDHDVCSADPYLTDITNVDVALHPNDKGHVALADLVVEIVEPQLEDSSTRRTESPTKQGTPVSNTDSGATDPGSSDSGTGDSGTDDSGTGDSESGDSESGDSEPASSPGTETSSVDTSSPEDMGLPELARTGSEAPLQLAIGSALMGLGLTTMWMRSRVIDTVWR